MKILVTGSAGFIGSAVSLRLLERGDEVMGIDDLNSYYDVELKKARLARHLDSPRYSHVTADLADRGRIEDAFASYEPEMVVHLAAQAGVRYGSTNPHVYVSSNITGFLHVLEGCRAVRAKHLVFASSSSVYGANTKLPSSEHDSTEHPLSIYAATKKANEMMAHSYAHLYGIPCTGLRFFTVYGPWGRPDMAFFAFTRAIIAGEPIPVFNHGRHTRSFTYIDDVVDGTVRALENIPGSDSTWMSERPDPASSRAPYRIYNIGSTERVELLRYIQVLETCIGRRAEMRMMPLQPGDVVDTGADVTDLVAAVGYAPSTSVEEGLSRFVEWYRDYYGSS